MVPDAPLVARFAGDLDRLSAPGERLGLAVSGGPDSLALLLLAAAARPGRIEATTIDHALRTESRAEAELVAEICQRLSVPHRILTVEWDEEPAAALQERAREARYRLIAGWLRARDLPAVCTGHHRDDQAETLLMRLARGSGVRGLAAMRPTSSVPGSAGFRLLRPLLGWGRAELAAVCADAGVLPADDPSNADERFERVRVRQWLAAADGLDAAAVARSVDHLRKADEAIEWAVEREWAEAVGQTDNGMTYLAGTVPEEIRRRILARIVAQLATEGGPDLRGRELDQLAASLESGGRGTLRGVLCNGGTPWRFEPSPPRSLGCG
jgi:tRNA(Ile)-lysidine synthase